MEFLNQILSSRYKLTRKIAEGGISHIYLAQDASESRQVAVKILKKEYTSQRIEDIIRFQSEANIVAKLSHANILRVFESNEFESYYYLVMEYFDGSNLSDIIKECELTVDETVRIILVISKALDYIHNRQIIHRDLKPGNILVREKNGSMDFADLKIIDFGLAQVKEFRDINDKDEILGTFGYMSPEQTGVIKREVDERSDLYSLGIIFYQLLANDLPFKGNNITSIIHQHIAKKPAPFSSFKREIPFILERIVLRLLEKEPEKRYQSARGLQYDLELFINQERNFELGTKDKSVKLNYHTNLIGRDDEFARLKNGFESSILGNGSLCFIGGEAGRGKSRISQEITNYIQSRRKVVIEGKCFSSENKTPFNPIKEILAQYVKIFQKYPPERQEEIRQELSESLGVLAGIITKLAPVMKFIIDEKAPIVELDPERESKRFLMVAGQLFLKLSQVEQGLVIFIDDLQWLDSGSFDLLVEITIGIRDYPLFIIGTYRDNELNEGHLVNKFIKEAEQNHLPLYLIELKPFDLARMNQFVAGLLHEKDENVKAISEFIVSKSSGNPFFAIEIIKQLVTEKAIYFQNDRWSLNREILEQVEIADTLIDIVLRRIQILNQKEADLLSYAAAIGRTFEMKDLFFLVAMDKKEVVQIIDKAIKLQLLEEDQRAKGKILFIHDRIKEAFYKNIGDEKRKKIHLEIARVFEETFEERVAEDFIFELTHHYIEGGDEDKILIFAIPSGIRAKENYANEEALKFFSIAKKILESRNQKNSAIWIKIVEYIGEIYLIIGENDLAIHAYQEIFLLKETRLDKSKCLKEICIAYFKKGNWKKCEEFAEKGLALLGEKLPTDRAFVLLGIGLELLKRILINLFPFIFKQRRAPQNADKYRLIILYYATLNWSYILSDSFKFVRSVLRMLNRAERKLGKSKELILSLGGYGGMNMAIPFFKKAQKFHELALNLSHETNDEWSIAHCEQFLGFFYQWQGDLTRSNAYFLKSEFRFQKIGDLWELGTVKNGLSANYFYLAEYQKSIHYAKEWHEISRKINDDFGKSISHANILWAYTELGNYDKAQEYAEKSKKVIEGQEIEFALCLLNIYQGHLFTEKEELEKSYPLLKKARDIEKRNNFIKIYTTVLHPYMAEAYILESLSKKGKLSVQENSSLLKYIDKSSSVAMVKTKSWSVNYGIALRSRALYYFLCDKPKKSLKYFSLAIELLKKQGRKFELAKTLFYQANLLAHLGENIDSKQKIQSSYRIFKEIQARVYVRKVSNLLGIQEEETSSSIRLMEKQKLSSIIKVSQDISSVLNLNQLLKEVMAKAIEVTGARRGYLFIQNEDTYELELRASKEIEDSDEMEFSFHIVDSVYKNGKTLITDDAMSDQELLKFPSVVKYGLKSILCVPIRHHEKIIGVCYLDNPLSSHVFSEEDAQLLGVFISQAAIALDNASLYDNLEKKVEQRTQELSLAYEKLNLAYSKMKGEMMLAKKIQNSIMPKNIGKVNELSFHIQYLPLMEVGGDIYDIYALGEEKVRIFLADATGHGVAASLITMLIKSEYEKLKISQESPSKIFENLNRIFYHSYRSLNVFFTGVILDIFIKEKKILYSSAGHPAQFLIENGELVEMAKTGRAVNIYPEINCVDREISFKNKLKLLLYSDGIYEEFAANKEEFGYERLVEAVQHNATRPINYIMNDLIQRVQNFVGRGEYNDDITLVGVE